MVLADSFGILDEPEIELWILVGICPGIVKFNRISKCQRRVLRELDIRCIELLERFDGFCGEFEGDYRICPVVKYPMWDVFDFDSLGGIW